MSAAAFMRKLSETILQMVMEDKAKVIKFHTGDSKYAMGKEALDKKGPQYWDSVTRNLIREKDPLKAGLDKLWQDFSGTEGLDPATGDPLFTDLTWQVLDAIKELIDHGHFCGKHSRGGFVHADQPCSCHSPAVFAPVLQPHPWFWPALPDHHHLLLTA